MIAQTLFQFTPLREGRLAVSVYGIIDYALFQFTPLREGRRLYYESSFEDVVFQFTPLREGRLVVLRKFF